MVSPTDEARARRLVELLAANRFAEAVAGFDATMKAGLPADKLRHTWQSLVDQAGAFQAVAGTRSETRDAHEIVHVTCRFERAALDAQVAFDREHRIAGLYFVPTPAPAADTWKAPPYAKESAFEENDISIGSGEWQLPGTLTLPVGPGPFAAVVLVHGSGPRDRDETFGPNRPFRDLAWGLASRGVAVVRYDKRTVVHAAKLAGVRDFTAREEVIDDAIAAAAAARAAPKIDPRRVFLLGHSLGGYLAPRILEAETSFAGAIILAGSTRPMEELLIEQWNYIATLDGTVSREEAAKIAEIEAELARLKDPSFSAASPPVYGLPASYWIDLRGYDPVATAKTIARPMFIAQGGRDYQVTKADFDDWKKGLAARKDVAFRAYPDLNHLFFAGSGPGNPAEYDKEGHVSGEVVEDIASWVSDRRAR